MPNHIAISSSRDIGRGMTFTIRSGSLHRDDTLNMEMPGGHSVQAGVERFDPTGLYITIDGARLKCRPWRTGDGDAVRPTGTISKWTVDQVLEAEPA